MAVAKKLFAADVAVSHRRINPKVKLMLEHEEREKELNRIAEHFSLRGATVDSEIAVAIENYQTAFVEKGLAILSDRRYRFVLSVIDGDFPRAVLARQNLKFERYRMSERRNTSRFYDVKLHGPSAQRNGTLISAADPWQDASSDVVTAKPTSSYPIGIGGLTFAALAFFALVFRRAPKRRIQ